MAEILKGAPVANAITEQLIVRAAALKTKGIVPTLAIVRVGERGDDLAYERGAVKRCEKVGIAVRPFILDANASQAELLSVIHQINLDDTIHGCLIFRPLPKQMDERCMRGA